jgi:hypothetical protein
MSRRLWALALAVVMIASAIVVVPAAVQAAHSASAPAPMNSGARAAAGTIVIFTYDGYGYFASTFYPGPSSYGTLYFEIEDPSGDLFVNVTISDPNATRDGVGTPAFQLEVPINQTTDVFQSWLTNVHYNFPSNLVYAGGWNITATAPLGGTTVNPLYLDTYGLETSSSPTYDSVVLPGESVTLLWDAYALQYLDSNSPGPYNYLTNLTMTGTYEAYNGVNNVTTPLFAHTWQSLPITPVGQTTLTIPDNATPGFYLYVYLYATVYQNGQEVQNASSNYAFLVGYPEVEVGYTSSSPMSSCAGGTDYFGEGQTVFACAVAGAGYGGAFSPLGGLTVQIVYRNESGPVTLTGAPTSLTTDSTGSIFFSFTATSPPFTYPLIPYPYSNAVNYTVAYPTATAWGETHYTQWGIVPFWITEPAGTGDVAVSLNQAVYFPGQAITASWTIGSSNATTGALSPAYWELENSLRDVIGQGTLSGTSATGSAAVTLPAGYVGEFYFGVFAENSTRVFSGWASAIVSSPVVNVNPSALTYLPGTSVSVSVSSEGTGGATGLTLHYTVWAYYYSGSDTLQNSGVSQSGTVANGSSFTISVPKSDSPAYYEVEAWLQDSAGAVLASSYVEIDELSGFALVLSLQTSSSYSDGSYQPGQTLSFTYSLSAYGLQTVPTVYTYYVTIEETGVEQEHQGGGTSGSFQVTIPSNQGSGTIEVIMELEGTGFGSNGPNCGTNYCEAYDLVTVNAHPSILNEELGANSGVTVGWVILLVVILVVAVLLVLMFRRRRPPAPAGAPPASTTSPMPPPAPAPTGSAPPEWKEPTPRSNGDQPPMPTPPPGAE